MIFDDNPPAKTQPTPKDWRFEVPAERERMLATGETELISLEQFAKEVRKELA